MQRHNRYPLILIIAGLVLLVLLLAWNNAARAEGPCPDGWAHQWQDPIGYVCINPDTGDPVLIDFARNLHGMEPLNTVEEGPARPSGDCPPGYDRVAYTTPVDGESHFCSSRDNDNGAPTAPDKAWKDFKEENSDPADVPTGRRCWTRHRNEPPVYFDCNDWPTPPQCRPEDPGYPTCPEGD